MKFLAPIVPSFAASEAQRLAERHFGLAGEIEPLYSERDQNFRVRAHSGDWTLKIASVEETPEMIDCQIRTLRHIERVDPGLPVPRVHPTHDGGSSVTVSRGADSYIVYLLSYLPGMIAEKAPMTEALLHNHGGLVARLGRAMRGFFHPAACGRELLWDLRMAERFLPHVAKLQDPARRDMARAFIKNFAVRIIAGPIKASSSRAFTQFNLLRPRCTPKLDMVVAVVGGGVVSRETRLWCNSLINRELSGNFRKIRRPAPTLVPVRSRASISALMPLCKP